MAEDVDKPQVLRIYFKPGKGQHWDLRSTGNVFEVLKSYTVPAKRANPGDVMIFYNGDLRGKTYNDYIILRNKNSDDTVREVWFLRKGSLQKFLDRKIPVIFVCFTNITSAWQIYRVNFQMCFRSFNFEFC